MRRYYPSILALLTIALVVGCSQSKQNDDDEKAIRNIVRSYQEAYNAQDPSKLASYWDSDGTFINPVTGETATGKEAIEKLFSEKFSQNKKRHLEVTVKQITFPDKDEAIENGLMQIKIDDQPTQEVAYEAEYSKKNDKWLIKAIHEIELQEPSSNFTQLKSLQWMIGKWEDADENIEIAFDNSWDKYKNFITQYFKMTIFGQESIEGKQIIGWDEEKKTVRSWVFDSDGEFGEGMWKKVDKSWYASMRYTLSDGRVATSKNIYTQVDDDTYTFASIEREVDGEILPNLDPVTVERIE